MAKKITIEDIKRRAERMRESDVLKKYSSTPKGQMSNALEQMSRAAQKAVKSGGKGEKGSSSARTESSPSNESQPKRYVNLNGSVAALMGNPATGSAGMRKSLSKSSKSESDGGAQIRQPRTYQYGSYTLEVPDASKPYDAGAYAMINKVRTKEYTENRARDGMGLLPEEYRRKAQYAMQNGRTEEGRVLYGTDLENYIASMGELAELAEPKQEIYEQNLLQWDPEYRAKKELEKNNEKAVEFAGEDKALKDQDAWNTFDAGAAKVHEKYKNEIDGGGIYANYELDILVMQRNADLQKNQEDYDAVVKAAENGEDAMALWEEISGQNQSGRKRTQDVSQYLSLNKTTGAPLDAVMTYDDARAFAGGYKEAPDLDDEAAAVFGDWLLLEEEIQYASDYIFKHGQGSVYNEGYIRQLEDAQNQLLTGKVNPWNRAGYQAGNTLLGGLEYGEDIGRFAWSNISSGIKDWEKLGLGDKVDEKMTLPEIEAFAEEMREKYGVNINTTKLYTWGEIYDELIKEQTKQILTDSWAGDLHNRLDQNYLASHADKNMGDHYMSLGRDIAEFGVGKIPKVGEFLNIVANTGKTARDTLRETGDLDAAYAASGENMADSLVRSKIKDFIKEIPGKAIADDFGYSPGLSKEEKDSWLDDDKVIQRAESFARGKIEEAIESAILPEKEQPAKEAKDWEMIAPEEPEEALPQPEKNKSSIKPMTLGDALRDSVKGVAGVYSVSPSTSEQNRQLSKLLGRDVKQGEFVISSGTLARMAQRGATEEIIQSLPYVMFELEDVSMGEDGAIEFSWEQDGDRIYADTAFDPLLQDRFWIKDIYRTRRR